MPNDLISQIKVGTVTYDIKDTWARDHLQKPMSFVGKTTTPLTDGATTNPIIIDGESYTAVTGDVVIVSDSKEFIFDGEKWEEFGDEGSYVVKGTYTVTGTIGDKSYQPAGTVSTPTFTGTTATVTVSGNIAAKDLTVAETAATGVTAIEFSGTPSGTISTPTLTLDPVAIAAEGLYTVPATIAAPAVTTKTFTGTTATISVETSDAVTAVGDHSYRPAGSVSATGTAASGHSFSGTTATISATASYQPAGTVSQPSVTVTETTATFLKTASGTFVTGVSGGVATSSYVGTVTGEVLDLGSKVSSVSAISAPTATVVTTNGAVVTGVTAALDSAPTFTGTTATITATASYRPAGSVTGAHSFSGTTATISHSLTKATITATGSYQPAGTINVVVAAPTIATTETKSISVAGTATPTGSVAQPTFSGNTLTISKKLVAKLTQTSISASGSYQPAGNVSQPVFAGTTATHSHTFTGSVNLS